jgi:hypothetical protein
MSYESRHRIAQQSDAFVTPVLPRPSLGRRWPRRSGAGANAARPGAISRAMDARSLRDAGISPAAAAYESGKSFWQPFGPLR